MKYDISAKCTKNIVSFYLNVAKRYMANTDKWYYAYTLSGDTITIHDACHAQNMHEDR